VTIRVGTSSWTDPTLVRDTGFYPKAASSAEERLRYYASIFPVVEVDATFYAPLSPETSRLWVERTPPSFRMEIKAYGLFTGHPIRPATLWKDLRAEIPDEHRGKRNLYRHHLPDAVLDEAWKRFDHALDPLADAGRLGAVVFQWPPWFTAKRENRDHLAAVAGRLPGRRLAVELRHGSWLSERDRERTLALLEDHGLVYVCVDEPQGFPTSVPPLVVATHPDLAMVRFHGHNADNWNRKGITAAERFRYLYGADELASWVPPLKALDQQVRETHALMNNCYRDFGVRNAYQLGHLLGEGLQPDAPLLDAGG
jgi:uncharacterized protein YecE (DUF72 family)